MSRKTDQRNDRNYVRKIEKGVHQVHAEADIDAPAEHIHNEFSEQIKARVEVTWKAQINSNESART